MMGHGIPAGIRNTASEHGHITRDVGRQTLRDALHLLNRQQSCDVQLNASRCQVPDERACELATGIGNRNLDEDVAAPRRDLTRLRGHLVELV